MRWAGLDFKASPVAIRQVLARVDGKLAFKETKVDSYRRDMSLLADDTPL